MQPNATKEAQCSRMPPRRPSAAECHQGGPGQPNATKEAPGSRMPPRRPRAAECHQGGPGQPNATKEAQCSGSCSRPHLAAAPGLLPGHLLFINGAPQLRAARVE